METPDPVTGPINLRNAGEFTIGELARTVVDTTGSSSKIVYRPLPEDNPKQRRPEIARADNALGWKPTVPLREGLGRTTFYFEDLLRDDRACQVALQPD